MPKTKSLLSKAERAAAKALLDARPEVIPNTRVCIDHAANAKWFAAVSAKMEALKLKGHQIGEFCDIAGVPD